MAERLCEPTVGRRRSLPSPGRPPAPPPRVFFAADLQESDERPNVRLRASRGRIAGPGNETKCMY
jgi:hypothetical protein